MKNLFVLLALLIFCACHPFFMFKPKSLKPLSKTASSALNNDKDRILIAIDSYGIPFVKAASIEGLVYALGFMHARDRLFQLDLVRHAALGRTSELFGEKTLEFDRKLRLLTYRLDEQLSKLTDDENRILKSYVQGVNDGALARGLSAEHFLLGVKFEEFSTRDVIAIARLQSWQLGSDLYSEILRLKLARSKLSFDEKQELISAVDEQGAAIIKGNETIKQQKLVLPGYLKNVGERHPLEKNLPRREGLLETSFGASNAWVINGNLSLDGHAILMNDPHLAHNWPSNFYLATLEANGFFATGATFVGLPAILIGASKNLSWGVTASCLNTQDSVLLNLSKTDENAYFVDNKKMSLEPWPQQFCLNKRGKCIEEMNLLSIFGPVINNRIEKWIDKDDAFAVQWTGFRADMHNKISLGFIELAKARSVNDAAIVVRSMTLPGVNIVLADIDGNIGYAYAGLVPKRDAAQNPYLPLDGAYRLSLWPGFLETKKLPALFNPENGYIVTANQNIYSNNADSDLAFGKQGAAPYRALRIEERIKGMIKKNQKVPFEDLATIQLDETSVEAKELAFRLGPICKAIWKKPDAARRNFATEIANFDGRYTKESIGALPYEYLLHEIVKGQLQKAIGKSVPESLAYVFQVSYAIKRALLKELQGQNTAMFADHRSHKEDLHEFLGKSCELAFNRLAKNVGTRTWKWRWGRNHYLERQSPLAKAPLIGSFFRDKKREVSGVASAPMAEAGTPVAYGANLRFLAKMTNPPEIHAVIDSGNSGTIGDKHAFDQVKLWHEGKSVLIETDWSNALKSSETSFTLAR